MYSDGKNTYIMSGINSDVVGSIRTLYEQWKEQPRDLVRNLMENTVEDSCESVYQYMIDHVTYKLDPAGEQLIKSPARLLADGYGDCKSLTMFISCCLHCMRISHIIRFVDFDGDGQFTHVYPVALLEDGREFILDMCETDPEDGTILIDYARPYVNKKDFIYYE